MVFSARWESTISQHKNRFVYSLTSPKVLLTSGYTAAALSNEHGLPEELPVLSKPYRRDELAAQLRVIAGGLST